VPNLSRDGKKPLNKWTADGSPVGGLCAASKLICQRVKGPLQCQTCYGSGKNFLRDNNIPAEYVKEFKDKEKLLREKVSDDRKAFEEKVKLFITRCKKAHDTLKAEAVEKFKEEEKPWFLMWKARFLRSREKPVLPEEWSEGDGPIDGYYDPEVDGENTQENMIEAIADQMECDLLVAGANIRRKSLGKYKKPTAEEIKEQRNQSRLAYLKTALERKGSMTSKEWLGYLVLRSGKRQNDPGMEERGSEETVLSFSKFDW